MSVAFDNLKKHLNNFLNKYFVQIINKLLLLVCFIFSVLSIPSLTYGESGSLYNEYAYNESSMQPSDTDESEQNNTRNTIGIVPKFIKFNKKVSKEINKAAETIDRKVSPPSPGKVEENKTQIYFIMGGDFADNGDIKSNFRYGAQLDLPRFQKYWKLKFANQDEKRNRGQSSLTRSQRTRNTNDDVFVGVSFSRRWENIDIDYKPQIDIHKGVGVDHSIEAHTKYEFRNFSFIPSLEFFANHDEGAGSSSLIKFIYQIARPLALEQSNDARFVYLSDVLDVNHTVGFAYTPTDRLNLAIRYFRSFANDESYRLAAYGYYMDSNYVIYQKIFSIQIRPYFVYERPDNFLLTRGVVANLKVSF